MFDFLKKAPVPEPEPGPTAAEIAAEIVKLLPPAPSPQVVLDGSAAGLIALLGYMLDELRALNDNTIHKFNPDDPRKLRLIGIRGGKS